MASRKEILEMLSRGEIDVHRATELLAHPQEFAPETTPETTPDSVPGIAPVFELTDTEEIFEILTTKYLTSPYCPPFSEQDKAQKRG